jgi:hypothetical protein
VNPHTFTTVEPGKSTPGTRRPLRSHFVPADSPLVGRRRRALCGELVDEARQHATAPACLDCQQILRDHDRWLDQEAEPTR